MTISRDDFLSQTAVRYVEKTIYGKDYRFKNLNEAEKADYELALQDKKAGMSYKKGRALLICKTMVDADGNRILSDSDLNAVMQLDAQITSAIYSVLNDHVGYEDGEIEDLVKNSNGVAG